LRSFFLLLPSSRHRLILWMAFYVLQQKKYQAVMYVCSCVLIALCLLKHKSVKI
jgi:hypothetical protein